MVGDEVSPVISDDFENVWCTTSVGVDASVGAREDLRDTINSFGDGTLAVPGEPVDLASFGLLYPCRELVEICISSRIRQPKLFEGHAETLDRYQETHFVPPWNMHVLFDRKHCEHFDNPGPQGPSHLIFFSLQLLQA